MSRYRWRLEYLCSWCCRAPEPSSLLRQRPTATKGPGLPSSSSSRDEELTKTSWSSSLLRPFDGVLMGKVRIWFCDFWYGSRICGKWRYDSGRRASHHSVKLTGQREMTEMKRLNCHVEDKAYIYILKKTVMNNKYTSDKKNKRRASWANLWCSQRSCLLFVGQKNHARESEGRS